MSTNAERYDAMVKKASPNSKKARDFFGAFGIGGLICMLGQACNLLYVYLGATEQNAKTLVSMTLIVLAAILTGCGVFNDIAKLAGAGTLVPITGFANSIVAPAMEFSAEGRVLGTGAKLFSISGPVIAYGTLAASIYGVFAYFFLV